MKDKPIFKSAQGEAAVAAFYEGVLARWPVAHEKLDLPTRHGSTFVIASGPVSAPPMVLLHGSSSNSATWMGDVIEYSSHYRVYAVDLLGEPGKSAPTRPSLKGQEYVEWLDDLLQALQIERAVLVGMSLGGWVALRYATARPSRVDKLVLISTGGVTSLRLLWLLRLIGLSLLGKWGAKAIQRAVFRDVAIPQEVAHFTDLIREHYNPRIEALPIFTDQELGRLTMPTMLLAGAQDITVDATATAARMGRLLSRFKAVVLPDAGHVLLNTPAHIVPFLVDGQGLSPSP